VIFFIERPNLLFQMRGVVNLVPFLFRDAHEETTGAALDPDLIV
jgi:hypothetical protein